MYVYFGHHRCATLWASNIIMGVCRELDLRYTQEDRYGSVPDQLPAIDFFSHINADMRIVWQLAGVEFKAFHVIRHPRDILVSSYFSDRYSHPVYRDEFAGFRDRLNAVSFDEGLRLELERRTAEFEALAAWNYHDPRIYETRFERITTDARAEFARIFDFMGLPIARRGSQLYAALVRLAAKKALKRVGIRVRTPVLPRPWLDVIIDRKSFTRLAGRQKGTEDPHSHYRKGVAGDWQNHLAGENKALFKERWGQLLIDLGYEQNLDW